MVRFRGYICNLFLLMQSEYVGLFAAQQWNRFLLIVELPFFQDFMSLLSLTICQVSNLWESKVNVVLSHFIKNKTRLSEEAMAVLIDVDAYAHFVHSCFHLQINQKV